MPRRRAADVSPELWSQLMGPEPLPIAFQEGSAAAHPNFESYMRESQVDGSVPLRFDCAATDAVAVREIAERAIDELERRAKEEGAELLPSTLVATSVEEHSGHRRFRVLVIARHRKPIVARAVVRDE